MSMPPDRSSAAPETGTAPPHLIDARSRGRGAARSTGSPPVPRGAAPRRRPKVLLKRLAVFAPIFLIFGGLVLLGYDDLVDPGADVASAQVLPAGEASAVSLDEGEDLTMWRPAAEPATSCTIRTPDGRDLILGPGQAPAVQVDGVTYHAVGGREADVAGNRWVTCPPDGVRLLQGTPGDNGTSRLVMGVIGLVIAVVMLGVDIVVDRAIRDLPPPLTP